MAMTIVLNDMRTAPTAAARSPTEQGRWHRRLRLPHPLRRRLRYRRPRSPARGIVESHRRPSQRTSLAAARYRSSGLLTWLVLDCSTGASERDARVTALADHDRLD
jgi:hypothetical protein